MRVTKRNTIVPNVIHARCGETQREKYGCIYTGIDKNLSSVLDISIRLLQVQYCIYEWILYLELTIYSEWTTVIRQVVSIYIALFTKANVYVHYSRWRDPNAW